ncbi:hypothetical protein FB566_0307 [Stackebrandtia endophytica]|uniref:Excreted virulence factor EspC (Type VII ESX diderm) n=1 Tax=Stackebrandtia endophytica TaxID=1496996 RepID=A0A543AQH9_9ACTN|nr:hypothetical protein [Stackebrandtia endophytica]TQL74819.1 hypothetical protein FB566_0307 [Stackebrandtia endophytica]
MSEGRSEVDIVALRAIGIDMIDAAESLRTDAAYVLPGLSEDPEAPCRSYAADERNVPGQSVSRGYEAAVDSVITLMDNLATALDFLGETAGRVATDFSRTDTELAIEVDTVEDETVDGAITQNRD